MTNLVEYGHNFDNIKWTKETGIIVRPDVLQDPNLNQHADGFKKTSTGSYIFQTLTTNLLAETTYTISIYVWATPTNSPTIKLYYDLNNGLGKQQTSDIGNYHASGEWRRRSFTFTTSVNVGANSHKVGFQINRTSSEINEYFFYGFQLVLGNTPSTYEVSQTNIMNVGYVPGTSEFTISPSTILKTIYHTLNGSDKLFIRDYNLFKFPNAFDLEYWFKSNITLVQTDVSHSPEFNEVNEIDRLEAKISVSNYVYQRLNSYSFSPGKTYTLSYYIRRISGGTGSSRSRLWSSNGGEIASSYSTIRDYWELRTWTFTLPENFTGAILECGINISTSGSNMIFEIADAQLVNNIVREEFIRTSSELLQLVIKPDSIIPSQAQLFNQTPFHKLIGVEGGMAQINGNAINFGNAIGQINPDPPYNFVYDILGPDDTFKPFGLLDPFGDWNAALVNIKNRVTTKGISCYIDYPLFPKINYTFSFYLKNLYTSNLTFNFSVSSTSGNSQSIIDYDFRNAKVMNGNLIEDVIYGEDLNPNETTPDTQVPYIKNNLPVRKFNVNPDVNNDRAFIYIELEPGSFQLNKTYIVKCWAKTWENDPEREIRSVYLGAIYKKQDGTIVNRSNISTEVILRTDWFIPSYNNITFPSDIDLTYKPRIGIFAYGKVALADLQLTSNDSFESSYLSISAGSAWTRYSITFTPTLAFFNSKVVKWEPWRINPLVIEEKKPIIKVNIIPPSDDQISAPIGITGFQLVEGIEPIVYEPTNLQYVISPFSIKNKINLKYNFPTVKDVTPTIVIKPSFIDNSKKIPNTRMGLNMAKYEHEPIFLNLWETGSRIGVRRRGIFNRENNNGPPNFGYSIQVQNRFIVSLNNSWDETWVNLELDDYGNLTKIPSYENLQSMGYSGPENPEINIYALIGRSTPLSWFFFEYRPPYHNSGIYVLKWEGDCDIDIQNKNNLTPGPYPGTIISSIPGRLEINYDCSVQYQGGNKHNHIRTGFYFRISRINPLDYPRNFILCEKRYENIISNGELYYPFYLDQLRPAAVCRTMHFADTNNDPESVWVEARHSKFWKKQIDMANKSFRHWWCNIPSLADDNYIRELAKLTRDYLDPRLKVYLEYTNEYWNGNMIGSRVSNARAEYYGYIDEFPNAVNPFWEASQKAFAYRSQEIFNIWQEEFSGPKGLLQPVQLYKDPLEQEKRLVRVMGGLRSNISNVKNVWKYGSEKSYDSDKPWDLYAASAYYANSLHKEKIQPTNFNDVANYAWNELNTIYLNSDSRQIEAANYTWSLSPNEKEIVHFGAYEGGPHVIGQASVGSASDSFWNYLKIIWGFHLDSELSYQQLKAQFDWWNSVTENKKDSIFCFFESAIMQTSFMTFGLSRHLTSRPISQHLSSPKTRAFYDQANLNDFHRILIKNPNWNPTIYNIYLNGTSYYITLTSNVTINFIFDSNKISKSTKVFFIQDDIGNREVYFPQNVKFDENGKKFVDYDPYYITHAEFKNFNNTVYCVMRSVIGKFKKLPNWEYPKKVFWREISKQYIFEKTNLISSTRDLKKWSITETVNGMNYSGGVLAPSGKIYFIPFNTNQFLEICCIQYRTINKSQYGIPLSQNGQHYFGGCLGHDGFIYCSPYNSTHIARLNVSNSEYTSSEMLSTNIIDLTQTEKFRGCVSTIFGNKIIFIPYNANKVLFYDTETNTFEATDFGLDLNGTAKWFGAIEGPDNKVYCVPYNSSKILVIDYINMTAIFTDYGLNLLQSNKFAGSVFNPITGVIYFVPFSFDYILKLNVFTQIATLTRFGLSESDLIGTEKWIGGIIGPDNRIYFMFHQKNLFLEINCNTEEAKLTTGSFQGWYTGDTFNRKHIGAVLSPNGSAFLVPYNAGEIKEFEFPSQTLSKQICLDSRINKSF